MSDAALAISNLVYRYAELLDLGQFEAVGKLFEHATITTDMSDEVRVGSAAMTAQFTEWTRRYEDGTPRTRHMTTNLIIELGDDGTTAKARSYYTVFQQTDELPLQPIISGRYHDEFAVIDGAWAFTKRHYINELFGDLSAHLLRPVQ
ncbi:MAG TPA: nuclear transport factor 2 family protein [Acidimicrobiales bacterium]|jgi:3-phenylpropionate/cinnamic acid dioxygenase small subunit|nr:nuclear transport factor 2 family protein [Acidimicrobiales bacterium]